MQDTTVSGIRFASDSGAKSRRRFFSRAVRHANEDELLARVLITSWSLATGRTLRGVAAAVADRGRADQLLGRRPHPGAQNGDRMTLTASQDDWLRVRSYLQEHRHALAVDAAGDYPAERRMAGTPLLAAPEWQPAEPVPLHDIELEFIPRPRRPRPAAAPPDRRRAAAARAAGRDPLPRYSDALRDLAAPAVFENRPTYRLTEADLAKPRLAFTRGRYFDGVDTGEAAAHEYAATRLGGRRAPPGQPAAGLRARIADPCDLSRRPANLAITTLTLRFDAATGRASFLLHWRDPAKVGHAGGMYQVIPVGVFQPSGEASWHEREDFSLWRCMLREFDEELRGTPGRVRGGAGGLRLLAVRPAHGRRAGPGPDPGVVPGPRRRPADLRHRPAHRGGDRQPGVRRAVQPGPAAATTRAACSRRGSSPPTSSTAS